MRKPNLGLLAYEEVDYCAHAVTERWNGMSDKERRTNATGPILKISPETLRKLQTLKIDDLAGNKCIAEKATALVLGLSDLDEGISLKAITQHFGGMLGMRAVMIAS